jgi:hypothetical protein
MRPALSLQVSLQFARRAQRRDPFFAAWAVRRFWTQPEKRHVQSQGSTQAIAGHCLVEFASEKVLQVCCFDHLREAISMLSFSKVLKRPRPLSVLLLTMLSVAPASAQTLENVAGSWSGSGMMKPSDGPQERVRCKADYIVRNTGLSVRMTVRCASDAYKMELSANIDQQGTDLSGNWFESQYRQGGKVSGRNLDGLIEAKVESDTLTALLTVQTNGARQTFSMESPGAWVSQVTINLVRDPK